MERLARAATRRPSRCPAAWPKRLVRLHFSGLKTAVLQYVQRTGPLNDQQRVDLAASFQRAVIACWWTGP